MVAGRSVLVQSPASLRFKVEVLVSARNFSDSGVWAKVARFSLTTRACFGASMLRFNAHEISFQVNSIISSADLVTNLSAALIVIDIISHKNIHCITTYDTNKVDR